MRKSLSVLVTCGLLAIITTPSFGEWVVIDLGTLNPDNSGTGTGRGISDNGAYVTGWTSSPSHATETPFHFNDANGNLQVDPGEMINLLDVLNASTDPPGEYTRGQTSSVNSSGIVVGRTMSPANDGFRTTDPPFLGDAPASGVNVLAINESGLATAATSDNKVTYVLELDNTWTALPCTSDWSSAHDINDNNLICGFDDGSNGVRQGAVWEHDGAQWVKTILPAIPDNREGEAWGLNDNGQVVGRNRDTGSKLKRAVIWENDGSGWTIQRLDTDGFQAQAQDINNAGVIVGSDSAVTTGIMWTPDGSGGYIRSNVQDLVAGSGWTVSEAAGISDQGWIVGTGSFEGGASHAILITDADIPPRLHAGQLGAYGVVPEKPGYEFLNLSFGKSGYTNPTREHIPGKTNIALIYPFDKPRDPLPPIDTAIERIDAIMAQQDVDELYGACLGEERGYWAEFDYLSQLYDHVKLNWPELKVFQWLSVPLTPPATMRADGFIYDYYTTDVTDWQNKMQAHLDTGKELIPVLWASPPSFGLGSPTEVWLNAASQKAAWAHEHDLPVMIFAVSEPGPSFNSWFSDPLAEPWRDWVMNELVLLPGDANMDGVVNEADAEILAANWSKASGAFWAEGDFNHDGQVNDIDATIMAANWYNTGDLSSTVPEPGAGLLLGIGCLIVLARKLVR